MCPHGREGREPGSKCGSLCCHINSHWLPWRYVSLNWLRVACGCAARVCHWLNQYVLLSGWSACSLLLLTCSFSTSQQHCKFLCLSHVCSAASSLESSHSDPSGFSRSTATFHIPFRDRDGTLGHKSLLHKSQGSLRPAVTEPSLAFSPHTAILFCLW